MSTCFMDAPLKSSSSKQSRKTLQLHTNNLHSHIFFFPYTGMELPWIEWGMLPLFRVLTFDNPSRINMLYTVLFENLQRLMEDFQIRALREALGALHIINIMVPYTDFQCLIEDFWILKRRTCYTLRGPVMPYMGLEAPKMYPNPCIFSYRVLKRCKDRSRFTCI